MGTVLATVVGLVALVWFASLERRERSHVVVGVIFGLLLFEAMMLPSSGNVTAGLFRMQAFGQDIRLPQLLIPVALLSRGWVRGLPRRTSPEALAWVAFLTWYTTAFFVGVLNGNPFEQALFEAKSILFIGGAAALAAGVPLRPILDARTLGRWVTALAVVVAVLGPLMLVGWSMPLSVPGIVTMEEFGSIVVDGRSLLVIVGLVGLLVEVCRPDVRLRVVLASLVLLTSSVYGHQRAAWISMGIAISAVAFISLGPTWARRARVTGSQAALVGAGLLAAVSLTVALNAEKESTVISESLEQTFLADAQTQSADARRGLWAASADLAAERPVLGWGLGKQIVLVDKPMTPHNLGFELLIRSGGIGLATFVVAVAMTVWASFSVWRRHRNPAVAAFALACAIGLLTLIGKGMVESMFESFRLATTFGLLVGGVLSARASLDQTGPGQARDARLGVSAF